MLANASTTLALSVDVFRVQLGVYSVSACWYQY